jgi:hypothetical protein
MVGGAGAVAADLIAFGFFNFELTASKQTLIDTLIQPLGLGGVCLMKMNGNKTRAAFVGFFIIALVSAAQAAVIPVTGWIVHNGTSTVGGTASAPTFTPGDNITLMAPFSDVVLANDGDSVEVKTTLTMNTRTGTGINTLNTQLRFALLDDSVNGTVTANDIPNVGFIIEYTNQATGGLIREQQSTTQTNPFTSPTNIGNGSQDSGADSIQGANPGPVLFSLKLTRNGGKIDLSGYISGTDAVSTNPYLANYTVNGYSSVNFPANGTFTFNRVALQLGDGVNAASASLADSSVITIPEPATCVLAGAAAVGGLMIRRRARRGSRRGK